ncbi:MAG: NUDIX domain-containing protein, partial [Chthoniobacterales bacterium]
AEAGLSREIKEEVGLDVPQLDYLCSFVNYYDYETNTYPVVDLFFTAHLPNNAHPQCLDDVADIAWLHPSEVDRNRIAFPSVRAALDLLASRQ